MLKLNQIHKSYGTRQVLTQINFSLVSGERAAILGPNGSGKTTLMRIISGEEVPDQGTIQFSPPGLKWYYMPQSRQLPEGTRISEVLQRGKEHPAELEAKLESLSRQLSFAPQDETLQEAFDRALAALTHTDQDQDALLKVLLVFGLDRFELTTPVAILSGGQRARLYLAAAVLSRARLLLLDEPTNDLDEPMLEWLEDWFRAFSGAILFVSHDRAFLNRTATQILELSPQTHTVTLYPGNYDAWRERKSAESAAALADWTRQQTEINDLREAALHLRANAKFRRGGKADSGDKFLIGFFANRSKGTVKRATRIEERLEKLQTDDKLEKPGRHWKMKMDFLSLNETGMRALELRELAVGYGDHPLISEISLSLSKGQKCVLAGPNGSGKTTLIRTIMGELPPLSGEVRFGSNVVPGLMTQGLQASCFKANAFETIRSVSNLNETEIRRFLSYYLFFGDEVFVPAEVLSNGQSARLMLAEMAVTGVNFLVMDEPLNHLDIESREQFGDAVMNFPGTVLAVVHDRYFRERFAEVVWRVDNGRIRVL